MRLPKNILCNVFTVFGYSCSAFYAKRGGENIYFITKYLSRY